MMYWRLVGSLILMINIIADGILVPTCYVIAIKLRKKAPSPAGEGWGEEDKNKEKALFNPPHPNLLPEGEGTVRA